MSKQYNPDVWVIVKICNKSPYYRILAGWYGGFASGDYWKMSSGLTNIVEHKEYYELHNTSGSVYNCGKHDERLCMITSSVFESFNSEGIMLEQVELSNIDKSLVQ